MRTSSLRRIVLAGSTALAVALFFASAGGAAHAATIYPILRSSKKNRAILRPAEASEPRKSLRIGAAERILARKAL